MTFSVVLDDEIIDGLDLDMAVKIVERRLSETYSIYVEIPLSPNMRTWYSNGERVAIVRPTKRARVKAAANKRIMGQFRPFTRK